MSPMEATMSTQKKTQPWKPALEEHFMDFLKFLDVRSAVTGHLPSLPSYLKEPLRTLSFKKALKSFVFRSTPPYHDAPVSFSLLMRIWDGNPGWELLDSQSARHFFETLVKINCRGPLGIGLSLEDGGSHFFRKGLVAQSWPLPLAPKAQDPLLALDWVRTKVSEYLGERVLTAVEEGSPPLLNDLLFSTATPHSIVIGIVLEALQRYHQIAPEGVLSGHPFNEFLAKVAQPDNQVPATVGDWLWMSLFYPRWLPSESGEPPIPASLSSLPFLQANPVYVLLNVNKNLDSFPSGDPAARRQLLIFMSTCSHTLRTYLLEKTFEVSAPVSPASIWKRLAESLKASGRFSKKLKEAGTVDTLRAVHRVARRLFTLITVAILGGVLLLGATQESAGWLISSSILGVGLISLQWLAYFAAGKLLPYLGPEEEANPWLGHDQAIRWIQFLRTQIWPSISLEASGGVDAGGEEAFFFQSVVKLWETQTVRIGAEYVVGCGSKVSPPDSLGSVFSSSELQRLRTELGAIQKSGPGARSDLRDAPRPSVPLDVGDAVRREIRVLDQLLKDPVTQENLEERFRVSLPKSEGVSESQPPPQKSEPPPPRSKRRKRKTSREK